jgi:lysyl-tRNA synthetase class I
MLLQIVRQDTEDEMHKLIDRISGEGITREEARKHNRPEGERRARRFVYRFEPEDEAFHFSLSFAKAQVEKEELVKALQSVLERLLREMRDEGPGASKGMTADRRSRSPELDA